MVVDPADRLRDIPGHLLQRDVGNEPVVGRREDETFVGERLRLGVHLLLVAFLPAAAVNPEHDRPVLRAGRREHVEHLPLVPGLRVRLISMDLLGCGAAGLLVAEQYRQTDEDEHRE